MPLLTPTVSGANRGVGLGLVTVLATKPDTIVFAGTRNVAASKDLHDLAAKYPNIVHVVQLTSADEVDNKAAVEVIREKTGRLDVVIANAYGSSFYFPRVLHQLTCVLQGVSATSLDQWPPFLWRHTAVIS